MAESEGLIVEKKILKLLKRRGPVELSVLWREVKGQSFGATDIVCAAYEMSTRDEVWWLSVGQDYAIIGLPEQPKPENPAEFLGLSKIEGDLLPDPKYFHAAASPSGAHPHEPNVNRP